MTRKEIENELKRFSTDVMCVEYADMPEEIALTFASKALECGELSSINEINEWYEKRLKPNLFILGENEYTQATIESLKIQFLIAGTDFGSSRQRDLGQKWSDTIRGYLGELGVQQILKKNFQLNASLGHEKGELKDFLPSDIHKIKFDSDLDYRDSKINISIKTTKSNGIWLDIPGDQFSHSDVYILTKIGITTDHLFSFFKHISVFKDKVLKRGQDSGFLTEDEAKKIYDDVPSFNKIYGYIPGFITSDKTYDVYRYEGRMPKSKFTITNWIGKYEETYLKEIQAKENAKTIEFAGIGKFSQSNRYLFGTKSLNYNKQDWQNLIISKI